MVAGTRLKSPEYHQLRQILEHVGDGVILMNPGGEIAWANRAALDMHHCRSLAELGPDADAYARLFRLSDDRGKNAPAGQIAIVQAVLR